MISIAPITVVACITSVKLFAMSAAIDGGRSICDMRFAIVSATSSARAPKRTNPLVADITLSMNLPTDSPLRRACDSSSR